MKMGMYPPTLSFAVVYDTALKYSWHGRPSMVKLFCEGTTGGRLQFNSVVYEEKGETLMYIEDVQYYDITQIQFYRSLASFWL